MTLHLRDEGVGGKNQEERRGEKRKGREARKLPDVSTGVTDCARRYGWSVKPKIRYTRILREVKLKDEFGVLLFSHEASGEKQRMTKNWKGLKQVPQQND